MEPHLVPAELVELQLAFIARIMFGFKAYSHLTNSNDKINEAVSSSYCFDLAVRILLKFPHEVSQFLRHLLILDGWSILRKG